MDLNELRKINETVVCLQLFSAKAMPLVLLILTQSMGFAEEPEHATTTDHFPTNHLSSVIFKTAKIIFLRLVSEGFLF